MLLMKAIWAIIGLISIIMSLSENAEKLKTE